MKILNDSTDYVFMEFVLLINKSLGDVQSFSFPLFHSYKRKTARRLARAQEGNFSNKNLGMRKPKDGSPLRRISPLGA